LNKIKIKWNWIQIEAEYKLNYVPHASSGIIFLQSVERCAIKKCFLIPSNLVRLLEIFVISDGRLLKI
jgi:hypothetical protein